jgi:hypothetical protein
VLRPAADPEPKVTADKVVAEPELGAAGFNERMISQHTRGILSAAFISISGDSTPGSGMHWNSMTPLSLARWTSIPMPLELRDFQDLLRLLRAHPDWREELRVVLLTEELLTLPGPVRELAAAQERLTETMAQLAEEQGRMATNQGRSAEEQRRLGEGQQRFEVQMGEMRGWFLEQRYRTYAPAHFGRFLRQVQPVDMGRLADALRERVPESELAEVLLAELVLMGRLPTPSGPRTIWVVLEVSTTVDRSDV